MSIRFVWPCRWACIFDARLQAGRYAAGHFKKALLDFIKRHPGARCAPLTSHSLARACLAYGYNDLKQTFASVDCVPPTPCST
jgi:hypothetical protein